MFKENWRKIWDLANMRDVPVDEGFDEFRQAVKYGKNIEGIDFDFKAAQEKWLKMTEEEQNEAIEDYRQYCQAGYWKRVKEYNRESE